MTIPAPMTADRLALCKEATESEWFRWELGMRAVEGATGIDAGTVTMIGRFGVTTTRGHYGGLALAPDVYEPGVRGWLLEFVREGHGDGRMCTHWSRSACCWYVVRGRGQFLEIPRIPTEPEALLAALKAAPRKP